MTKKNPQKLEILLLLVVVELIVLSNELGDEDDERYHYRYCRKKKLLMAGQTVITAVVCCHLLSTRKAMIDTMKRFLFDHLRQLSRVTNLICVERVSLYSRRKCIGFVL